MPEHDSDLVYVVVLANGTPEWSSLSWRDIVNEKRRYFHPVGVKGWPKEPPEYIGFRYDGKLQSIYHVDSYRLITDAADMSTEIPEIDARGWPNWVPFFVYQLGPAIYPKKEIRNGNIWPNGRVCAELEVLLNANTIAEARDLTKQRHSHG